MPCAFGYDMSLYMCPNHGLQARWLTTVTDLFQAGTVSPQSNTKTVSDPMGDLEMEMLKNSMVP